MAKELVHGSVGTTMTQAEFEATGLHVINSQSTGDIIYATSSTQLTGLAIGTSNSVLQVVGGVPSWQTAVTLNDTLTMSDGKNIQIGTTSGSQIATASTQKVGFFGATPVVQAAKTAHNNWASIGDIVNALVQLGLFNAS